MVVKKALVILAEGAEEMEAVIVIDVLRRAGVDVVVAGLNAAANSPVQCSRKVRIAPDCSLSDVIAEGSSFDVIALPGGREGADNLAASSDVGVLLHKQESNGGIIAAVCAGPTALKAHGIGKGKKITSYPAFKDDLNKDYEYIEEPVVVDDNLVTSRGPGTSFDFALAIADKLAGSEISETIKKQMLLP